jgi:hypothetical protein
LEKHLAKWCRDNKGTEGTVRAQPNLETSSGVVTNDTGPSYEFWIAESARLIDAVPLNANGSLFCADKALALAKTGTRLG